MRGFNSVWFCITDAHEAMKNLNADQAMWWVKIANREMNRLLEKGGKNSESLRRAESTACAEVRRRYGTNRPE